MRSALLRALKKATKELIQDYKDKLAEALPQISPALIEQAISGNILAIKEINDRVLGKSVSPIIDITPSSQSFLPTPEEKEKIKRAFEDLE